jgi:hypothetical protein
MNGTSRCKRETAFFALLKPSGAESLTSFRLSFAFSETSKLPLGGNRFVEKLSSHSKLPSRAANLCYQKFLIEVHFAARNFPFSEDSREPDKFVFHRQLASWIETNLWIFESIEQLDIE